MSVSILIFGIIMLVIAAVLTANWGTSEWSWIEFLPPAILGITSIFFYFFNSDDLDSDDEELERQVSIDRKARKQVRDKEKKLVKDLWEAFKNPSKKR